MSFRCRVLRRMVVLAVLVPVTQACLVLSLNPAYDDESIGWSEALVGDWYDPEDHVSVRIDPAEWRSYRLHYVHPIETGYLTGYVTSLGNERYMDLMPARGEDHGSFLVPVHAVVRIELEGDRLEVTPLSYDWFFDKLRGGRQGPGVSATFDQKENVLISAPTARMRAWLRLQPPAAAVFGPGAVFVRKGESPPGEKSAPRRQEFRGY